MLPIKIGDTVTLKSGGPLMTVSLIRGNPALAECHWFADKLVRTDTFPIHSLQREEPSRPGSYC